ncbi:MAG TPA: tRNA 2-selenouridine(34) synthase MnmH [Chitinophagaceae bacterium]|nr:tRNA 2-selenouridine(34) synthase MnmH [Chitinophagaceae bacterium]
MEAFFIYTYVADNFVSMSTRLVINEFIDNVSQQLIIDVRSPAEYFHAHFPNAINIPLFDNEERKIVGTAYKQKSREDAIKIGLDFFGPKMRKIVEEVEDLLKDRKEESPNKDYSANSVAIYCWRGGMRSAAIAWLLQLYGFKISVLAGGYKAYRNYILQILAYPWNFKVLGGYTGSGKTELLKSLKNAGEPAIDLEALAVHKGSAFGNINLPPQPSQEMFENNLATELNAYDRQQSIWIEDESQRIGSINLPKDFWRILRQSPVYFLDVPFEKRLQHITEEYGPLDRGKIGDAIKRITKRLGGLETKNALRFLEEGNLKECFSILLKYYDKHYLKSLHNRDNLSSLLTNINCNEAGGAAISSLLNQTLA